MHAQLFDESTVPVPCTIRGATLTGKFNCLVVVITKYMTVTVTGLFSWRRTIRITLQVLSGGLPLGWCNAKQGRGGEGGRETPKGNSVPRRSKLFHAPNHIMSFHYILLENITKDSKH